MAMEPGIDYKITKIEKGPLNRFKNQNLLLKKFGELGLHIYKAITGKRTAEELRKDLEIEPDIFAEMLGYMEEAGMVELSAVEAGGAETRESKRETGNAELETQFAEQETGEPAPPWVKKDLLRPKEEPEKEKGRAKEEETKEEPESPEMPDEIKPIDIEPIGLEEEKPEKDSEEDNEEEHAEKSPKEEEPAEEKKEEEEFEPVKAEEKEGNEEEPKGGMEFEKEETEETSKETKEPEKSHEEELETTQLEMKEEIEPVSHHGAEEEELSPVERIIKEKYGETGIKVYKLIDGQRTAEEIIKETGVSESKLVEMLDFMDEEGIIKLEYPGGEKKKGKEEPAPTVAESKFKPLAEEEDEAIENSGVKKEVGPINVPIKAPVDMVQALYAKSNVLLKFGDKGGKILEAVNGKNDVLDFAIKNSMPLYEVETVLAFLLEKRLVMLKGMPRTDVRKKYGDEGYSVYKKYGKEGVMLYELVGKDLKLKDMAKRIYADTAANKAKFVDMFDFIHKTLRIDLPIDKELLLRELEKG